METKILNNNIPVRLDYYQYCIETWERIFEQIDLRSKNKIVDLCTGWSPKLELALLKSDFQGILYALDKSKDNLKCFQAIISPFPRKLKIKLIVSDLLENRKKNNLKADVVLANHIVDDLLLGFFLKKTNSKINPFENMELMKKTWKKLLLDKSIFNKVYFKLKKLLCSVTRISGHIIIAQYLGYQEKLYGWHEASKSCKKLIKTLKEDLITSGKFVEDKGLINNAFRHLKNPYFSKKDVTCLRRIG